MKLLDHTTNDQETKFQLKVRQPAMREAIKDKTKKLNIRTGKYVAIANPDLTDEWLKEVILSPQLLSHQ